MVKTIWKVKIRFGFIRHKLIYFFSIENLTFYKKIGPKPACLTTKFVSFFSRRKLALPSLLKNILFRDYYDSLSLEEFGKPNIWALKCTACKKSFSSTHVLPFIKNWNKFWSLHLIFMTKEGIFYINFLTFPACF